MKNEIELIKNRILLVRGKCILIDADLARVYGVSTKVLNQAVRRNKERFPSDFMFQLNKEEKKEVVTNCDHLKTLKYSSFNPYAFTEHGALMLASVLNSKRAIEISLFIVRAFIALRSTLSMHKELAKRIGQLESRVANHDENIIAIINMIKNLTETKKVSKQNRIGFKP